MFRNDVRKCTIAVILMIIVGMMLSIAALAYIPAYRELVVTIAKPFILILTYL